MLKGPPGNFKQSAVPSAVDCAAWCASGGGHSAGGHVNLGLPWLPATSNGTIPVCIPLSGPPTSRAASCWGLRQEPLRAWAEQLALCQQRCQAFPVLHRHLELLEAEALEDDSFAPAQASGIIFASFYAQGDRGIEARLTAQCIAPHSRTGKGGAGWQAVRRVLLGKLRFSTVARLLGVCQVDAQGAATLLPRIEVQVRHNVPNAAPGPCVIQQLLLVKAAPHEP